MKHQTKNPLRAMANHLGLKVVFVNYFTDDIHGRLLPREKRILINAHKPRVEHIFTLLHEIGHFLIHFKNPRHQHHPRIFDIHWKIEWLVNLSSKMRRCLRYLFNKTSGKEWEADLWAFCAFIYVAKHFGCRDDLLAFLDRRRDKSWTFFLAALAIAYCNTKTLIKSFSKRLLLPFRAI